MKSLIDITGVDVSGASANVAGEQVTVSRKDITKENTFKKFLAMLANTVLMSKSVVHEEIDFGQVNISNGGVSLSPQLILSANPNRVAVSIRNIGGKNLFIGDQNVAIGTGFLLKSTDTVPLRISVWGNIYGICDDAAGTVAAFVEE
jgi:hypothetical protein